MYKLLIADDEPLVCVGIQSMLDWRTLGVEVVGTARNGGQAADMIEQHRPDIVISDIKMPVKDGLQLARESNEKYGRLPVFIILTSYEDFEYARKAIQAQASDYLIKLELDEEALSDAVNNALELVRRHKASLPGSQVLARNSMQALRDKFFIRLLNDLFDSDELYQMQKRDLGIKLDADAFAVASCSIIPPEGHQAGNQLSVFSNTMPLVRETLPRYLNCHIISLDMWHFTVVFCFSEAQAGEHKSLINETLRKTAQLLHNYLGVSLHSSIGRLMKNPRELTISYRQSQRCSHGMTDADPIAFSDEQSGKDSTALTEEMHQLRRSIRRAFEEIDTELLNSSLSLIADTCRKNPDDILEAMDITCNILYMATSLLPEGENLLEQIFADFPEGYRSLYRIRDTENIALWILRLRDGCNELLQKRNQSYKQRVVENVKAYINENLEKRLSLQEVAAIFNFNPNYLSHLFSKYSTEGFVEYITATRIAAAKEMLARGEFHIYEVAEKLGFESSFYFSKVFKKVEGVSPREYQQSLAKRGAGASV